jgi:ubiquinone/menaquinone biosynthesis C-methylase UbiE
VLKIPKDAFAAEKLRARLAVSRELEELVKTYSPRFPEIQDLNTADFWDQLNDRPHIRGKDSPMTYHKLDIISQTIKNEKATVLNVGSGTGDLEDIVLKKNRKFNLEWYGVDISPKSIKDCKKKFPTAYFEIEDIRKLRFENRTFDRVIVMEVLEHIRPQDTFKALSEVNRVLKINGRFIVSIPLNEGLERMVKKGENPNAHVRVYTPELIEAELKLSGFKVEKREFLYAFHQFYFFKTIIAKYFLPGIRKPNNLIIFAQK